MDVRRRTISELEKKRNEAEQVLAVLYGKAGRVLFVGDVPSVDQDMRSSFEEFNRSREKNTELITEIQQTEAHRQELISQAAEMKQRIGELNGQWRSRMEELGNALYDHYTALLSESFGSFFTEAAVEKKTLADLEHKASLVRKEAESQKAFSKFVSQIKLVPINTSISQHKKKIAAILAKGARVVFDGGELEHIYPDGIPSAELSQVYQRAQTLKEEILTQEQYLSSLEAEEKTVCEHLASVDAEDNPARRVERIRQEIRQMDSEQELLCREAGRRYADAYVGFDGTITGTDSSAAAEFLPDIARNRQNVMSYSRRIRILELDGSIETEERKIAAMESVIEDNERKIESLNEQSSAMKQKIEGIKAEKEDLIVKKSALEQEEGAAVKLLDDAQNVTSS